MTKKNTLKIDGIENVIPTVLKHGRAKVMHFGFFEIRKYKGKAVKHKGFASKEAVVPSHNRLVFKPLKEIKRAIQ